MFNCKYITISLFIVCLIAAEDSYAQEPSSSLVAEHGKQAPEDSFGRGTPRSSAIGFLTAASKQDFERAAEYLDTRNLPAAVAAIPRAELARQFDFIVSRSVWLDDYTLDDTFDGAQGDELPDYRDELVRIKTSDGEVILFMQRIPRSDGELIWKISNASVALIPALFAEFGYPAWVENIRKRMPDAGSFLGLETFKWLIMLGMALISWPFIYLIGLGLTRVFSRPDRPVYPLLRKIMTRPMVALGILMVMGESLKRLGAGALAQQVMEARTLLILVTVWLCWSVISLVRDFQSEKLIAKGRPGAAQLLRPMGNLIKLLILLAGVLFWLSNLGVNISTVLAGLGVGGLALALALQKPLEDLMGALTLYSQAPVRVGDFCRYGDITGSVEDIGLRTTRIRTLAHTLVSIPNSRIAFVEIENFSARKQVHYKPVLRLRYDTTPAQIRDVLERLLRVLKNNARVLDEPLRVRFTDFDIDAILIKIHAYIDTDNIPEFLEVSEQLNLEVMQAVHSSGASFALPGRSVYTEEQPLKAAKPA